MDSTSTIIDWHLSLDILVEPCLPGLPNAPSWVPDWSRRHHRISSGYFRPETENPRQSDDPFTGDVVSLEPALLSGFVRNVGTLQQWITYVLQLQSDRTPESISQDLFMSPILKLEFKGEDRNNLHQVFKQWFIVLTADYSTYIPLCAPDLACALIFLINEPLSRYHRERCRAITGKRTFFTTLEGRGRTCRMG